MHSVVELYNKNTQEVHFYVLPCAHITQNALRQVCLPRKQRRDFRLQTAEFRDLQSFLGFCCVPSLVELTSNKFTIYTSVFVLRELNLLVSSCTVWPFLVKACTVWKNKGSCFTVQCGCVSKGHNGWRGKQKLIKFRTILCFGYWKGNIYDTCRPPYYYINQTTETTMPVTAINGFGDTDIAKERL